MIKFTVNIVVIQSYNLCREIKNVLPVYCIYIGILIPTSTFIFVIFIIL